MMRRTVSGSNGSANGSANGWPQKPDSLHQNENNGHRSSLPSFKGHQINQNGGRLGSPIRPGSSGRLGSPPRRGSKAFHRNFLKGVISRSKVVIFVFQVLLVVTFLTIFLASRPLFFLDSYKVVFQAEPDILIPFKPTGRLHPITVDIGQMGIHNKGEITGISSAKSVRKINGIKVEIPEVVTDPSRFYQYFDSNDETHGEIMKHMEMRPSNVIGDCVPMQDWQTSFYPTCNGFHEISISDDFSWSASVFGTKGFFRLAWKVEKLIPFPMAQAVVMKTLKLDHTFEDDYYEKHRIEASAMERLTHSPHVIDIYGFCGQSLFSELADGQSLGKLSNKSSSIERLVIAIGVAEGLADVHEIDGKGNATLIHFDINPGNVISVDGRLKLNDFNIAVWRRWHQKEQKPCGVASHHPNPQWRSPEEVQNRSDLTEKVDVYSMGNIFYRLVCGKSPWGKLDGNPTKDEIHELKKKGEMPHVPHKVRHSSDPSVVAIREAMYKCFTLEPDERPSARSIANGLRKAYDVISMIQ